MPEQMSKEAAARIQSTQETSGHDTGKQSFPARAQSAADRNANASSNVNGATSSTAGGQSTGSNAHGTGGKGAQSEANSK